MAGRRKYVDIRTKQNGGNYFTLSYVGPHVTISGCNFLERIIERPTTHVGRYGFEKVRRKIKSSQFVEETVYSCSIEGLNHIEENRTF